MLEARGELSDAVVLDLFAGTGALGIEALSRGARKVIFVEQSPQVAEVIRRNLALLGLADRAQVVVGDALRFVRGRGLSEVEPPSLVLCDPPYAFDEWNELFNLLGDALVVCESNRAIGPPTGWSVLRTKTYGDTVITLCLREAEEGNGVGS
jgi:16S rRNA (guanine966-N2)-methyltransferase